MRSIVLALVALAFVGCGTCGSPTLAVRSPIAFGFEPFEVPGPRRILVPQMYEPSYDPMPCDPCMPQGVRMQRVIDPCAPGGAATMQAPMQAQPGI